jgi:uncharacterized protein RhaS with RHS repeats
MREYDPQIGRFFRIDPITDKFYDLTPYQYASNDPILNIDLDGLEGRSANDIQNPYVRASLRENVQRHVESFNKNASGAFKGTVSVGPGVGITATVGKNGIKAEVKGPQASVTTDLGGNTNGNVTAASGSLKGGVDKVLSGEVSAKVGVVDIKDGKIDATIATVDDSYQVGPGILKSGNTLEKKVSDGGNSTSISTDAKDVTVGANAGIIGVSIKANLEKAYNAIGDWFNAIGSYFKEVGNEASRTLHPDSNR